MLAPLATMGAVSRPVQGSSITLRIWPRWPSGVSMFWLAAWLITAAIPASARADEPAAERWQFGVTPYVWMAGLEGTVGVRGITAAVDANCRLVPLGCHALRGVREMREIYGLDLG